MKRHMLIITLLVGFGGGLQASASDNSIEESKTNSQQMQNLSKQPYYQAGLQKADADQPKQESAKRVYELKHQHFLKLHYLSTRGY